MSLRARSSFGVGHIGENLSGLLAFLLPDVLATAIEYFIDNYTFHLLAVVAAFVIMLKLRGKYRKECKTIFEQACDKLRA